MTLHILDTDHLSLALHGQEAVTARVEATPPEDLAITIITAEEQLTGWYSQVRKARTAEKLVRAYEGLFQIVDTLKRIQVLPFTASAVQRFQELRKSFPRQGSHDLAIAAIVLEADGVLVTPNRSDFDPVPGLRIDDWSKP